MQCDEIDNAAFLFITSLTKSTFFLLSFYFVNFSIAGLLPNKSGGG